MEAEAIYRSILDEQPSHPEILYLMSVLNLQVGRFDHAARFVEEAIAVNPDEPNYLNISGEAHLALQDVQTAIARYRQAIAINPDFAGAHNNLGNAHKEIGELENAITHYRRAIELDPGMAMSHNNLGLVLKGLRRTDEALDHFRKAVSIMPGYAEAHINLGSLLHESGRREEAVKHYRQALSVNPNIAVAHFNLGFAADESGNPEEAVEHYRRALTLQPDYAEAHNNLGNALDELGHFDAAIDHYERARRIRPDYPDAYRNLARLDPGRIRPSELEDLLATGSLSLPDKAQCYFTLGIVYNRAEEFDKAFESFREGNRLNRSSIEYDPASWTRHVDLLIDAYSEEFFANIVPEGSGSRRPVFIVGMHRSGTSLVEQILASHPDIYGAGELTTIGRLEASLTEQPGLTTAYPWSMHEFDQATILQCAERYLDEIAARSNDERYVTDKMPGNFLRIGLIRTLFPDCRIVHCKRNALDTCISNYFNAYATGNPYAYDLSELGQFYRDYERLMAHWHRIFGADILDVPYENLVNNEEVTITKLLDYLGLSWDNRCLEFNTNRRSVNNLNSMAVRQPIYTSSIDRWKRYEKHLKPLVDVLNA